MDSLILTLTIVGGIVSIGTIVIWINQNRKRIRGKVSWKQVEKGVIQLKEDLIKANYYPTLIVGIGRGGSIIGALLSGTLGNIPIIVIDRVYDWTYKERKDGFCENIKISKNIDRVLLVAGELHTGNTAKKYTEYFEKMGAKEIKMLTFMTESFPPFKPDYFYLQSDEKYLRFPWMLTKDYKRDSKINYNAK